MNQLIRLIYAITITLILSCEKNNIEPETAEMPSHVTDSIRMDPPKRATVPLKDVDVNLG